MSVSGEPAAFKFMSEPKRLRLDSLLGFTLTCNSVNYPLGSCLSALMIQNLQKSSEVLSADDPDRKSTCEEQQSLLSVASLLAFLS